MIYDLFPHNFEVLRSWFVVDRRQTEIYIQFFDAAMLSFYTPQNGDIKVLIFFELCYDVRFEETLP
jgi:hypothetical protein